MRVSSRFRLGVAVTFFASGHRRILLPRRRNHTGNIARFFLLCASCIFSVAAAAGRILLSAGIVPSVFLLPSFALFLAAALLFFSAAFPSAFSAVSAFAPSAAAAAAAASLTLASAQIISSAAAQQQQQNNTIHIAPRFMLCNTICGIFL